MDAITNAIFDSCEPKITPNIAVQEIDGKAIIVVEIIPGMQRPYYITVSYTHLESPSADGLY